MAFLFFGGILRFIEDSRQFLQSSGEFPEALRDSLSLQRGPGVVGDARCKRDSAGQLTMPNPINPERGSGALSYPFYAPRQ